MNVTAKPIVWEEDKSNKHWHDSVYGVWIAYDENDPIGQEYTAGWGEGDAESFGTLKEAMDWCQEQLDTWIAKVAVFTD